MNIFQLVILDYEERKKVYQNSSDDELISLYNQVPKYIEHPNFARVKIELNLIYNFTLKPLSLD